MLADRRTVQFIIGMAAIVSLVSAGTYYNQLIPLVGGMAILVIGAVSIRFPIAMLVLYAAMLPFDDINIPGIGSLTRGAGIVFTACYLLTRLKKIKLQIIPLPVWLFFGWALCSVIWALDQHTASSTVKMYIQQFLMIVLIANAIHEQPKALPWMMLFYTCSAVITSGLAVEKFLTNSSAASIRVQAFENQDEAHFAGVLLPALLFCVYQFMQTRARSYKILFFLMMMIVSLAVLASGTRSAWLGIALSLLFVIIPKLDRKKMMALLAISLLLGMIAINIPSLSAFITSRSSDAVSSGGSGRTSIWQVGLTIFQQQPVFGVGIGNFPKSFTKEMIDRTMLVSPDITYQGEGRVAHNIYLSSVVEYGVIGLMFFLLILFQLLRRGSHPYWNMIQSIGISYITMGFFLDLGNRKYFWFILAVAIGLQSLSKRTKDSKELEKSEQTHTLADSSLPFRNKPVGRRFS
ncbi:O-antigen ligase family protein [Paenibacillus contaminans]|nr:O-antigen ligase family protein [Paenibacillus contaminans]